jgi:hypothetical protein
MVDLNSIRADGEDSAIAVSASSSFHNFGVGACRRGRITHSEVMEGTQEQMVVVAAGSDGGVGRDCPAEGDEVAQHVEVDR